MFYTLLLFLNFFQSTTENPRVFELINTQSGLSNNVVYDICKDTEGFIWIATENGLNRYDGYEFKTFYHHPNDATALSSDIVRDLAEDEDGVLWIGTKHGLNSYDRKTETFRRYPANGKTPNGLDIQKIAIDKNGNIWFNTLRYFGYFDIASKEYQILDIAFDIHDMTIQDNHTIWAQSKTGKLRNVHVDSLIFHRKAERKTLLGRQIHYGNHSKSLWLPSIFANESFSVSTRIIPDLPDGLIPTELYEVNSHILLIGSDDGVYEYDDRTKKLKRLSLTKTPSTLTSQIRSIYQDRNQGIWIGTLGGVFYYDHYKNSFGHVDLTTNSSDVVMGMKSTEDGIYANTLGSGIYYKSHRAKGFDRLRIGSSFSEQELFVWDIEEIPENSYPVWMSTNAGLICYDPVNNRKKTIDLPTANSQFKQSFDLLNTSENYVWVATKERIHKVDKKTGKLLQTRDFGSQIPISFIQKMIKFQDNHVIATESDGLFLFDEKDDEVIPINSSQDSNQASPFITPIWDLHVFENTLWIGTGRGLYQLNQHDSLAKPILTNNQIVFSITHDESGQLWMGTGKGLISYDYETDKVHEYGALDGLENIEFNRRSVTTTKDGNILFGGVNGITFFNPQGIKTNTIVPPVYVTNIDVITADSTVTFQNDQKQIVLPYDQNTLELNFVALNYTNSSQNLYKYQLQGHDPDWVEAYTRKARYVQLPSGEYTFRVLASNNDGVWNEAGAKVQIQILPPFWERWWFRSSMLLVLLFLIWSVYKYRVKRLLEIERMKLRIARDLHDEVGSGLSGIALTSDILEHQVHQGEVKPHLVTRITKNARNLASTLDDIVWLINPEKETLGDFLLKTKTIAQELLNSQTVFFEEHIPESSKEKILPSEIKRNLLLFVKEAINNIAKHANAEEIHLSWTLNHKNLKLEIKDNGEGFDIHQKVEGNGIQSMKNRSQEMGAILDLNSNKNKGTQITISMKIP